jgi:hypothetical protein
MRPGRFRAKCKAEFPKTNRELLIAGAPNVFAEVDELFRDALANWERV